MRGSFFSIQLAEYAGVTCWSALHLIDRLDAPSSALSGCASCSRSKPAAAHGLLK